MKKLLIKKCDDRRAWYYKYIGYIVPLLAIANPFSDEYVSEERDGYLNFVEREDAEIVYVAGGNENDYKPLAGVVLTCPEKLS